MFLISGLMLVKPKGAPKIPGAFDSLKAWGSPQYFEGYHWFPTISSVDANTIRSSYGVFESIVLEIPRLTIGSSTRGFRQECSPIPFHVLEWSAVAFLLSCSGRSGLSWIGSS